MKLIVRSLSMQMTVIGQATRAKERDQAEMNQVSTYKKLGHSQRCITGL